MSLSLEAGLSSISIRRSAFKSVKEDEACAVAGLEAEPGGG
jgi:hypothetical protein